jgi:hypothetical protein
MAQNGRAAHFLGRFSGARPLSRFLRGFQTGGAQVSAKEVAGGREQKDAGVAEDLLAVGGPGIEGGRLNEDFGVTQVGGGSAVGADGAWSEGAV